MLYSCCSLSPSQTAFDELCLRHLQSLNTDRAAGILHPNQGPRQGWRAVLKSFECFGSLLFPLTVVCGRAGGELTAKCQKRGCELFYDYIMSGEAVGTVSQARLLTISAKSGTHCSLFRLRSHFGGDRLTDIYTITNHNQLLHLTYRGLYLKSIIPQL